MRGAAIPLIASAACISGLLLLLNLGGRDRSDSSDLMVYCAAVVMKPLEEIARGFEEETGIGVQLQFGGSGTLLSNLEISGQGDFYIAADSSYTDIAVERGLVVDTLALCEIRPVIAVGHDNPLGIRRVDDLLGEDVRLSLANPDAASIGKTTKELLESLGLWEEIHASIQRNGVFKPTVSGSATDVRLGVVDAAVVWDVTVNQFDKLDAVSLEGSENFIRHVTIGRLVSSERDGELEAFLDYLVTPNQGIAIFRKHGFGDAPITGLADVHVH